MEEHYNSISFRNSFVENDEDESELKVYLEGLMTALWIKAKL